MTNKDFIQFLKNYDASLKYTNSFIDESAEKSVCVYQRSGTAALTKKAGFGFLPITLILTYTNSAEAAQDKINEIFDFLFEKQTQTTNNINFNIIIDNNPVFLGRTDAGFFRYALDIDLYFTKGE